MPVVGHGARRDRLEPLSARRRASFSSARPIKTPTSTTGTSSRTSSVTISSISFSRSDSIGGPHALTDQLDIRVAFGEAWGSAFAAMVTGQSVYVDAHSAGQAQSVQLRSRATAEPRESESRLVQRGIAAVAAVRSLRQRPRRAAGRASRVDDLALGFAPIWAAFTNEQRTTRALTSVFPFVNALKVARPADRIADRQLDDVAADRGRSRDDYGTGQTNFGLPTQRTPAEVAADFHTVYDSLVVGATLPNVCSLDDYTSSLTGAENKLASRRFVRFTVANPGVHDDHGARARAAECAGGSRPACCISAAVRPSSRRSAAELHGRHAGELRRDVLADTASRRLRSRGLRMDQHQPHRRPDYPPIGRTCFDVTVTR